LPRLSGEDQGNVILKSALKRHSHLLLFTKHTERL
jgi:hypothetical protein